PVVVVDDLARLHGPSTGVVTLSITLNWAPRTRYDLASEAAQRSLYQVVLREADTEDEIETYLNADLLRRLWGKLTLAPAVREFWEAQHLILTRCAENPLRDVHRSENLSDPLPASRLRARPRSGLTGPPQAFCVCRELPGDMGLCAGVHGREQVAVRRHSGC